MKHISCSFDEAENMQSDSSNTVLKHCKVSCKSTEFQAQNISMTHDVPFSFSSSPFGFGVVWGWFCFCLVHFCFARPLLAKTKLRFLFLRSKTARAGLKKSYWNFPRKGASNVLVTSFLAISCGLGPHVFPSPSAGFFLDRK